MSDFTGCRTQGTFQNINIQLHAVAFSSEYFADASVNILTFISLLNISTEYCTLVYLQIQPAMHNDTLATWRALMLPLSVFSFVAPAIV